MPKHVLSRHVATVQQSELHAVNARLPSGPALYRAAQTFNYVACRQKRVILSRCQNLRSVTGGSSAAIYIWPAYFRTGEATTALEVLLGVTKTNFGAVSPPRLDMYVKTPSGTLVGETRLDFDGTVAGSIVTPDEISHKRLVIEGLSANTEYRLETQCTQGMTVVYMVVREAAARHADDSVAGVVNPAKFSDLNPIYDEHAQDLIDANNRLWRHNGGHLLSWTCDYEVSTTGSGVPSLTAGSANTWLDVYSSTRTIRIPAAYRNTRRRTTLPVRMAVLGQRSAGSGTTDIGLYDGTNRIAVTGIGAGSGLVWTVVSGTIPAADANWRLQFRQSDTSTTFKLYGISLFPWEA